MKKVLFLNGNQASEYYNSKRNLYEGVYATSIFKDNKLINKLIRRILLKLDFFSMDRLFGNWGKDIESYDLIIISACMYSPNIYKYIRKRTNKRVIHWYWNPVDKEINPEMLRDVNSEIWSFDKVDCIRYKLNYIHTYYFNKIELLHKEIVNDIYFMGADKGRLEILQKLKLEFENKNLKVDFHITKSKDSKNKNYRFEEKIPYNKVLEGIAQSKVVLDYVQQGQTGLTQRPMEALFFSKKLITNDKNIMKYDFYDKNNIFILGKDDINDIYKFVNSDYKFIDEKIIDKYDFKNWLKIILDYKN